MMKALENEWYAIKLSLDKKSQYADIRRKKPVYRNDFTGLIDILSRIPEIDGLQTVVLARPDDSEANRELQLCGCTLRYFIVNNDNGAIKCGLWDQFWTFDALDIDQSLCEAGHIIRHGYVLGQTLIHPHQIGSREWIRYVVNRERYVSGVSSIKPARHVTSASRSIDKREFLNAETLNIVEIEKFFSVRQSSLQPKSSATFNTEALAGIIRIGFLGSTKSNRRPFGSAGSLYRTSIIATYFNSNTKDSQVIRYESNGEIQVLTAEQGIRRLHHAAFLFQDSLSSWPCIIYIVSDYSEPANKYGSRAYRMLTLEAGMILQNLHLLCPAFGFNSRIAAGFDDEIASSILKLRENEIPLCAMVLG